MKLHSGAYEQVSVHVHYVQYYECRSLMHVSRYKLADQSIAIMAVILNTKLGTHLIIRDIVDSLFVTNGIPLTTAIWHAHMYIYVLVHKEGMAPQDSIGVGTGGLWGLQPPNV